MIAILFLAGVFVLALLAPKDSPEIENKNNTFNTGHSTLAKVIIKCLTEKG